MVCSRCSTSTLVDGATCPACGLPADDCPIVPPATTASAEREGEIIVGMIWVGGAMVLAAASYSSATGLVPYVIAGAAWLYGLARIMRGLAR
jgi:hypothetical protein